MKLGFDLGQGGESSPHIHVEERRLYLPSHTLVLEPTFSESKGISVEVNKTSEVKGSRGIES